MSGLRILQIAHDHPDWTAGGTEILAHDLVTGLNTLGDVSAHFLVAATSLHRPDLAPGTLGTHGQDIVLRTGVYDRFSMIRQDGTDWIASLGQVLKRLRPEIVHLHGLDRIGAEVLPVIRRLMPRARIILTLHDYQLICPNDGLMLTVPYGTRCERATPAACNRCFPAIDAARHALRQTQLRALMEPVDLFIAPSAFLRDRFIDWGLDPSRICLLPNAVPEWSALPETPRDRPNRFAFFGNIARHKGPLTLLDAATRLSGSDIRVSLNGGLGWADDAFRAEFNQKLTAAQPFAQHLGAYGPKDLPNLMRQTDWVVLPSVWWENAPLVLLEARMAGKPVICSSIGGMAEYVTDGIDGIHVPPGDAAALAETMRDLAEQPALWARLAGAAPKASHAAFVKAHLDLYAGLRDQVAA